MEKIRTIITAALFFTLFSIYADIYKTVPEYNQWQNMTIKEKAQAIVQFKSSPADIKKIEMLIVLSPPMTNDEKFQLKNYEDEIINKDSNKNNFLDNNPLTLEALKQADEIKNKNQSISNESSSDTDIKAHPQKNLIRILKEYEQNHKDNVKKVEANEKSYGKEKNVIALYDNGNFPEGKFFTYESIKNLKSLPSDKENYYFIGKLKADSLFNSSYRCFNYKEFGLWESLFGDGDDDMQFQINFPYDTPFVKKNTILYFNQSYPLNIDSITQAKNPLGKNRTKIVCTYYGTDVHALNSEK